MELNRGNLLNLAALFYGGSLLAACGLAWLVGVQPLSALHWNWADVGWGAAAVAPMLSAWFLAPNLRDLVVRSLGEVLSRCRWYDLVMLAAVAGIVEEIVFRGCLQMWLERFHPLAGLIVANVLFGLMHAVTPTYAILAGAIGVYFSWLMDVGGERNLVRPIVAHAVYDWVVFLLIVRSHRTAGERGT